MERLVQYWPVETVARLRMGSRQDQRPHVVEAVAGEAKLDVRQEDPRADAEFRKLVAEITLQREKFRWLLLGEEFPDTLVKRLRARVRIWIKGRRLRRALRQRAREVRPMA